jgi:hypothetical protein
MYIRTTTDPISLRDVSDPDRHPYLYECDGINGVEIYFETEINRQIYLDMQLQDRKIVRGNDTEDYVPQG